MRLSDMNQSNMLISNMNQSNASVGYEPIKYVDFKYEPIKCIGWHDYVPFRCPIGGILPPPVRKRSKRGFLPLGQLLLVQYEKPPFGSFCSNIIYRGNTGNCPGLHSIWHSPLSGGKETDISETQYEFGHMVQNLTFILLI